MELMLTITSMFGLLAAGFVAGDWLNRRAQAAELSTAQAKIRATLEAIQGVHNTNVQQLADLADRLGGIELMVKGMKR